MKIIAAVPGGAANRWALPGLQQSSLSVSDDDLAVWMLWLDRIPDTAWPDRSQVYAVDERPQWSSDEPVGVTRLSFVRRANGLTRQQFGEHWRDIHAPLAKRHHPSVIRYVQNVVIARLTPDSPEADGIAELSFASVDDMHARQYDSDAGREIIGADVRRFIDLSAGWRALVRPVGQAGQ
jgi:uncharacterized protein (TIGR02118 family)